MARTGIIGLAEASKQTSSRCSVDHSAVLLLAEIRPCSSGTLYDVQNHFSFRLLQPTNLVRSLDVDQHNQIPVLIFQVLKGNIPQDTGIVDEDVDPAILFDGRLDDLLAMLNAVVVGHGLSPCCSDLVDDNISCLYNNISMTRAIEEAQIAFVELPSPLNDPPRSLTTTLAPLDPKNVA